MSPSTDRSTETMSSRDRITAAMEMQDVDRFPVWLKMDNNTWRTMQPEAVRDMPGPQLLQAAGCDVMVGNGFPMHEQNPHVTVETKTEDHQVTTIWTTPDGTLTQVEAVDADTRSRHPVKFPVETVEDLKTYRWLYTDTEFTYESQGPELAADRFVEAIQHDYITISGTGPSPWMMMTEHAAGPVNTVYLHADHRELMEEVLQLMHEHNLRKLDVYLPILRTDTFWVSENTSTTLLSPEIFDRYCKPYLSDYFQLINENGIVSVAHMCGTLAALLESIDEMPNQVNEAFTTPPVGDTPLALGKQKLANTAIIGGTNAELWMHDVDHIVQTVAEDLAACPNRRGIFLTSAGVLPPIVSLEKARTVVEQLKQLPVG